MKTRLDKAKQALDDAGSKGVSREDQKHLLAIARTHAGADLVRRVAGHPSQPRGLTGTFSH